MKKLAKGPAMAALVGGMATGYVKKELDDKETDESRQVKERNICDKVSLVCV